MKVNFNPDVELLIREVRMLKVLGYNIPSEIENVSEAGGKFLRQAKSLEQVKKTQPKIGNTCIFLRLIKLFNYDLDSFIS